MPIDPNIPLMARAPVQVQSPIEALSQVLQIRNAQQQQQSGALELQEKKRQMAAEDALNNAMSVALKPDGSIDMDKFGQAVAGTPAASKFPGVAKAMADMQEQQGKVIEQKQKTAKGEADYAGSIASAAASYDDPEHQASVLLAGFASGTKSGIIPLEHSQAFIRGILDDNGQPDPVKVAAAIKQLKAASEEQRKLGSEEATSAARTSEASTAAEKFATEKPGMAADAAIKNQELAGMKGGILPKDQAEMVLRAREISIQNSRLALAENKASAPNQGAKSQDTSDVAETIKGMKDGTLPPILPGRATKDYTALLAEAHRQGYDLAGAATDWMATQKHLASMNGQTQLKLNQAVNQLPELLDTVDDLAKKWHGTNFPILNKANLALAKGGAYGSQVASVANQLDAQIADVTADLGNVYMGGNSPTDQALGLAAKSLNSTWDEKVLHDMINLARKNVQIRKNSINNTGVAGVGSDNPYAPKAPTSAAPTIRHFNPATGKLE